MANFKTIGYFQENDIMKTCNDILEKWQNSKREKPVSQEMSSEDVNIKLAKLLESQSLPITKQKQYTDEEKKIRDAILSQYGETPIDENESAENTESNDDMAIQKNLNAQTVANAEKMKREQAKIDSQKKKEKDKEDRYTYVLNLLTNTIFLVLISEKNRNNRRKIKKKNEKLPKESVGGSIVVQYCL